MDIVILNKNVQIIHNEIICSQNNRHGIDSNNESIHIRIHQNLSARYHHIDLPKTMLKVNIINNVQFLRL